MAACLTLLKFLPSLFPSNFPNRRVTGLFFFLTSSQQYFLFWKCAEDCSCTAWENDEICTKTCGTGAQRQQRTCGTPPYSGNGAGCDTETQDIACNTQKVGLHETIVRWSEVRSINKNFFGYSRHGLTAVSQQKTCWIQFTFLSEK